MREFTRTPEEIKAATSKKEKAINDQQLDVLRVVYFVNIQYRKYKSALRALSVLLSFKKNDEFALLATVFCYFSLKRYRKAGNLLKAIESKLQSKRAKVMFDYLNAMILTETGSRKHARNVYLRAKSNSASEIMSNFGQSVDQKKRK